MNLFQKDKGWVKKNPFQSLFLTDHINYIWLSKSIKKREKKSVTKNGFLILDSIVKNSKENQIWLKFVKNLYILNYLIFVWGRDINEISLESIQNNWLSLKLFFIFLLLLIFIFFPLHFYLNFSRTKHNHNIFNLIKNGK